MKTPIALEVEIPEETYHLLTRFIESNAPLGFNEVVSLAVSNFLIHQTSSYQACQSYSSSIYEGSQKTQVLKQ
ncbi:MAG: DUF2811 domain-containing protein [Crocosphaera sp.]|nr:DUF2811 domain-containing protein [Crocosphaera sp.]